MFILYFMGEKYFLKRYIGWIMRFLLFFADLICCFCNDIYKLGMNKAVFMP